MPLSKNNFRLWAVIGFETALLLSIAVIVRAIGLGEEALHDELYNFLAARGFLEHGQFLISAGAEPYNRAAFFTRIVAAFMSLFSPTLSVARVPAVLAGSILAISVFLWLRLNGERMAGWLAGLFIVFDPLLIQLSQVVRFYSLQHLAFLLGTIGIVLILFHRLPIATKLFAIFMTVLLFLLSLSLQEVSIFGLAGIIIFAGFHVWRKYFINLSSKTKYITTAVIVTAIFIAGAYSIYSGLLYKSIALYNYADLWAASNRENWRFYYAILHANYSPLWSLFPLLIIFASVRKPYLSLMCATVFATGFIGLSLASWKAERYFSYLLPFFFIIVALGIPEALKYFNQYANRMLLHPYFLKLPRVVKSVSLTAVGIVVFGSVAIANHAFLTTTRLLVRDHSSSFPLMGRSDGALSWSQASELLRPIAQDVDVVVSTDDLKAIYYLGRADYALSPSSLQTFRGIQPEFSASRSTNAVIVASVEAMQAIMECHESGLFVVQTMSLGSAAKSYPRQNATDYVSQRSEMIELPDEWGIIAYRWQTPPEKISKKCSIIDPVK